MRVEFLTPLRGSLICSYLIPTACAVGYILSPLRGSSDDPLSSLWQLRGQVQFIINQNIGADIRCSRIL